MTTTEITTTLPADVQPSTATIASSALASWAGALSDAAKIATAMCSTEFVPVNFRGQKNVGSAAVAIMKGAALGLDPIGALEAIYVISGRPAMYARIMVAVVVARGHEIWTEESTDQAVTVCGRRAGTSNVERSTWTIERAQRAGYAKNPRYQSNPQEMLYAKAAAEVARRIAPDALMGLSYSVEDLELEEKPEPVKIQRRRRKPTPTPAPARKEDSEGPDLDEEAESFNAAAVEGVGE